MKEQLSAMMDEELAEGELEGCLGRLRTDADLREAWSTYHLIGDALRGHTGGALGASFAERLAAEPTVLAPPAQKPRPARVVRYALSAAASVAAVSLVAWMALPLVAPPTVSVATAPAVAPVAEAPAPAPTVAVQAASPLVVPAAYGVNDYLIAHQGYSPSRAMSGLAPYVRSVSEDSGRR